MQPSFTRGFRLHHNGQVLDGAEFPSGRVLVLDDPERGLASAALSLADLLTGYNGARVEWPGDELVPTWALDELLRIAAYVTRGADAVGVGEPYPGDAARRVLSRLTDYLGTVRVARTGQPADAETHQYTRDPDAEMILNSLPPEAQRDIRAQLAAETAEDRTENS
ncbi:hypothetical protein ACFYRN_25115 [Streptomyces sp. NPDC005227]|uniref:hypothetical protein n=1 Tax=Streptomyces sp. NPDC005227 TaxID=3364707 RepID=UPI003680CC4D